MKRLASIASIFLILALFISCSSTGDAKPSQPTAAVTPAIEEIDYASSITLNWASDSFKEIVTVKSYVDGDTTHFYVPDLVSETGVLKARYLAVNTPESTGKIEEYGKKAAQFTREKLTNAAEIVIESDSSTLNLDSTGDRHLLWIWYREEGSEEFRNLNIELLQNGLAIASSSANNRYGSVCTSAIAQAKALKKNVYSGEKDPDFYYGEAVELTLKELRANSDQYNGIKVAFEGVITKNKNNSVYIEEYDPETGMYYGISIYYGFGLSGEGLDILKVGNRSRIVGTLQFYEAGGTYQVSGLTYRQMKPKDPGNIQKISDGHSGAYVLVDADTFNNGSVEVLDEEGNEKLLSWADAAMNTTVRMENLEVVDVYTTTDEASSSYGALT
ncbi:MAG: thermonuclease family protein, partial [Spirochaetales bacterium]|nr:thermonuclease family protein [Spirochaetales bacterium]